MVDILAFGAHPDDIEFGLGGILAKQASLGKTIVTVDLTLGDKGTSGTCDSRKEESLKAASLIGAKRLFLDFKDCEIFDSFEGRLKLIQVIREYRPKLVLAPQWKGENNHPDHLATGIMARHACRLARFKNILPETKPHFVEGILHYIAPHSDKVDFLVDITDYVEVWKKMMACHQSQMKTRDYIDLNLRVAAKLGMLIDKPYAQGLITGNPVVVDDLLKISKMTREI